MSVFNNNKEEIRILSKQIGGIAENMEQLRGLTRIRKYILPSGPYASYMHSDDYDLNDVVEEILDHLGLELKPNHEPNKKFRLEKKQEQK